MHRNQVIVLTNEDRALIQDAKLYLENLDDSLRYFEG